MLCHRSTETRGAAQQPAWPSTAHPHTRKGGPCPRGSLALGADPGLQCGPSHLHPMDRLLLPLDTMKLLRPQFAQEPLGGGQSPFPRMKSNRTVH